MNNFKHILNNKGLTLVELMIVLVLSLLLMAAVYMTYQLQNASGKSQLQVTATQQDLRAIMEIMAVDIMDAGCDPVPTKNIQGIVNTSGQTTLELVMDLNGNGTTNVLNTDAGEHVTYQRNMNNELVRTDTNANLSQVLASNVTQLDFTYYDAQHTTITPTGGGGTLTDDEAQSVRYILIDITKNSDSVDPQTHQEVTRHLQRTICRRNG
jgi:prepilin-type N-terminal cleavage/methylation domain-containing protein